MVMARGFYKGNERVMHKDLPTGALHNYAMRTTQTIKDFQPTHVIAVAEGGELKRKEILSTYKGNREKRRVPQDLKLQWNQATKLNEGLGIRMAKKTHYEGDDVMATYTKEVVKNEGTVHLMTGDKDLEQLKVYPTVSAGMFYSKAESTKDRKIPGITKENPRHSATTLGVAPHLIVDYLSLCGDSSDNFPGCKHIGPVTTKKLLREFGSLKNILRYAMKRTGSPFDTGWIVNDVKLKLAKNRDLILWTRDWVPELDQYHELDRETWEKLMVTFDGCIGSMYQWVYADKKVSKKCDPSLPKPFTDRIFRLINENLDKVEQARKLATLEDELTLDPLDNFQYQPPNMETAKRILIGEYNLEEVLEEINGLHVNQPSLSSFGILHSL